MFEFDQLWDVLERGWGQMYPESLLRYNRFLALNYIRKIVAREKVFVLMLKEMYVKEKQMFKCKEDLSKRKTKVAHRW